MIEFKGDIHSDVDKVENISDARDTLINDRIQQAVKEAKLGREELLTQIIQLMTSDASNKEWQRGVIKQLELLNYNLTGKIPTKSNH
jgi:hypothetical protein